MTPLFKKLNFKEQKTIVVLNAPSSFGAELTEMANSTAIVQDLSQEKAITFVMNFVTTQQEIDTFANTINSHLIGDAILWMCYPKGSSKNYSCDFNRDTGWASLGQIGLETVRQVAIDEDWSALRFRKVEYVKKITRRESYALTNGAKGKGYSESFNLQ
jgi:hypothetical protein